MGNKITFPGNISSMEPLIPQKDLPVLKEMAATLMKKASALGAVLNPTTAISVKELLRSMNSYYSIVKSDTPKSEVYLNFNPLFAYFMFPNLYPESVEFTQFLPRKT